MTGQPARAKLAELIAELQAMHDEDSPLGRAKMARSLDRTVRAVLGHVGDEAVWLAANEMVGTRRRSHAEVAAELGVSRYRVSNAITDYRRWVEGGTDLPR